MCRSPFTGPRCERKAVVDSGHYYALLEPEPADSPPGTAGQRPAPSSSTAEHAEHAEEHAEHAELASAAAEAKELPLKRILKRTAEAPGGLERWGERARVVVGEPPRGVVGSAPLQVKRAPDEFDEAIDSVADFNEMTRFLLDVSLIVAILALIILICFLIKHSGEFGARIFYLITGDTRLRMNSMDYMMPGANLLPSSVVRIERIILHDVPGGEGRDVFVEVDFGSNMLASTRVRLVQPVAAWSEPRAMQTLPEKDRPQHNRVVFTDKLEFNVRPFGEGDMTFRVKDQGIMGSELIGSVRLPAYDVLKKAKQNEYAPALNYSACLSNPLKAAHGRQSKARILIWVMLGDVD